MELSSRAICFSYRGGTQFQGYRFLPPGGTQFRSNCFSYRGGTRFRGAAFSSQGGTQFRGYLLFLTGVELRSAFPLLMITQ